MKSLCSLTLAFVAIFAGPADAADSFDWESGVVTMQATSKNFQYLQPWRRQSKTVTKTGIVFSKREILTTAEGLQNLTLLRLQRDGRGQWHEGKVVWINYHANIAIVSTDQDSFWTGLKPVALSDIANGRSDWQIIRWKNGNIERRAAEYNQFLVQDGRLTFIQHLQLDVSSEIDGVGWGEPLIANGKVIALATGQIENNCRFIPVSFFKPLLDARAKGQDRNLGYFPFVWSPVGNPETFDYLNLPGEPRGALVISLPSHPKISGDQFKPKDIILEVDGFEIDNEGYYRDPRHGLLIMENLGTRGHLAGDTIKFKVWREGKEVNLNYKLPPARFTDKLVPAQTFGEEPGYLIVGGLVFQPLTQPLLREFGAGWRRSAPFRLSYYADEPPSKDRDGLVLLTMVLPDPFNMGYQNYRFLVVDSMNGKKVSSLDDIRAALSKPSDGFHEVSYMKGSSIQTMVLDAKDEPEATARVHRHYRIPAASFFSQK